MKKLVTGIICLLVFTLAGCSNKPTTQTPPPVSEQVTSEVQQETHSPVVSEDSKQGQSEVTTTHEPSVETEVTPSTEPESTYSVDTTPEVAEPTPEVAPTPAPEQTTKPEPTSTPEPQPEPTPEPTPTPDATIEINGGGTIETKPSETPEPSQSQVQTWKEGQAHSMPKEGDIVIKADGTKVVLKRDPAFGNVLGGGQSVDIWTGVPGVVIGGHIKDYNNGVDSGKDMTVLKKSAKTGEVHTESEWSSIKFATNPNGEYRGDYDGEVFRTWWHWDAQCQDWYWEY